MDEVVAVAVGRIWYWQSEKPLFSRGYSGSLVLTNQRLVFLSSGGYASLFSAPSVSVGNIITEDFVASGLQKKGSLPIPLDRLDTCEVKRMWTLAAYLTIRFRDSGGLLKVGSFMCEGIQGLSKSILEDMQTSIEKAKKSH